MKTFLQFIQEDGEGGDPAGIPTTNTSNVQGLRTEPVIRKKNQYKYVRRNAQGNQASTGKYLTHSALVDYIKRRH